MTKLQIEHYIIEAFKRNKSKQVHLAVYNLAEELIRRCWKEDVFIVYTDGLRTMEDQALIYGKGRASYVYKGKQYGDSKASKVSNALPGSSFHNYALALDFVTCDGQGKNIDWVVGPKWRRVAAIAKELGFTWGGDWSSFRDYPHIQYDGGLSINQIKKGEFPEIITFKSTNISLSQPIKEEQKMKLSALQKTELANVYKHARQKGVFSSGEHEQDVLNDKMTHDQAIFLNGLIAGAAINGGKRIK